MTVRQAALNVSSACDKKSVLSSMASVVTDDAQQDSPVAAQGAEESPAAATGERRVRPASLSLATSSERQIPEQNLATVTMSERSQPVGAVAFVDATSGPNGCRQQLPGRQAADIAKRRAELFARLNQIDAQRSELERLRRERTHQSRQEVTGSSKDVAMGDLTRGSGTGDSGAALSNQDSSTHHEEHAMVGSSSPHPEKDASEVTKVQSSSGVGDVLSGSRQRPPDLAIEDVELSVGPSHSPIARHTPASPASLSSPTGRSSRVRTPSVLLSSQPGEGYSRRVPGSNTRLYQFSVRLVKDFLKMKEVGPFSAPIKELWAPEAIPNYEDVVDRPMDLRTVLRNLESGMYSVERPMSSPRPERTEARGFDPEKFVADVRLVFRNAMLYNRVGDHFYELARTLLERFERRFEQAPLPEQTQPALKKSPSLKRKKSSGPSRSGSQKRPSLDGVVTLTGAVGSVSRTAKKNKPKKTKKEHHAKKSKQERKVKEEEQLPILDLERKLKMLKREKLLMEAATSPASSPTSGTMVSPLEALAEHAMTYEEKKRLGEAINQLPAEKLGKLVQIVAKRSGKAEMNKDEEIELDIDAMDNKTLREMEAYINSIHVKKRGKKPAASLAQLAVDIARVEELLSRKKAEDPDAAAAAASILEREGDDGSKQRVQQTAGVREAPSPPPASTSNGTKDRVTQERSALSESDSSDESCASDSDSSDESGSSSGEE